MYIIALSDFSPIRGTTQCSRIHFPIGLRYAWLSDLSYTNWFQSYPRDETAINSDLFIMYIIALSDFSPIRGTTQCSRIHFPIGLRYAWLDFSPIRGTRLQ